MVMKGQKISDRYQIIKTVGEGGMANVYLAYDTILDRNVAVKILRGELASDEKFVRRFQREALSASSLSNPNIVEVYDVGEDNGQYYIVMEYIEGKHLKALLKKRGKLTISEVIDIMLQITNGLSVAHDSYIIHRDIKPQNIMILENGLVKITDFGIATAMNATQLTQTNSVMGSVHYLPPEQASGVKATPQSDIYSMGILMYELLTGELPYRGDNAIEIALKHLKQPMPSIKDILPNLPQSVENVILKASAKNPKNRYADAREMHEDLKTCLDPSRKDEPRWLYSFPEIENDKARKVLSKEFENLKDDDIKVKKDNQEEVEENNKKSKKKEDDEPIARKVNKEEYKKQNKLLVVLLSIFTGIVVIIATLVVLIPKITSRKMIEVPDVAGKSEQEAVKILQDAGFVIEDDTEEIPSVDTPEGKVVKTDPVAGKDRKKGSKITIYVSSGDSKLTIEDYTGKNYLEIKGALEAKGLIVSCEEKDVSDDEKFDEYSADQIVDQSVEPEEKVSIGSQIILYYKDVNLYPDFTDGSWTLEKANDFASEHNFNITPIYEAVDGYSEGEIYKQQYEKGSKIVSGTNFKLYIASSATGEEEPMDEID